MADAAPSSALPAKAALVLSALLGGAMMLGLAWTLPASPDARTGVQNEPVDSVRGHPAALLWLSGMVMFVLAGFELGIVLQDPVLFNASVFENIAVGAADATTTTTAAVKVESVTSTKATGATRVQAELVSYTG